MPFRLTNAPATCQALINNVLRAHLDRTVVAYLNNILVYSGNKAEHVHHVREVLECLYKAGLLLKLEKCEFHKKKVDFLGYNISTEGVQMSQDKIRDI